MAKKSKRPVDFDMLDRELSEGVSTRSQQNNTARPRCTDAEIKAYFDSKKVGHRKIVSVKVAFARDWCKQLHGRGSKSGYWRAEK